jgi:hypothetical protein
LGNQRDLKDKKDIRGSGGMDDAAALLFPGTPGSTACHAKRLPHPDY